MSLERFNEIHNQRIDNINSNINNLEKIQNNPSSFLDSIGNTKEDLEKHKEMVINKVEDKEHEIKTEEEGDLLNLAHLLTKDNNFTEEAKQRLKQEFDNIIQNEIRLTEEYINKIRVISFDINNNVNVHLSIVSIYKEYLNKILELRYQEKGLLNNELEGENQKQVDKIRIENKEQGLHTLQIEENQQQQNENILRQPLSQQGTIEYQQREKAVIIDINERARLIKDNNFTELDRYIETNSLFQEHDKEMARETLSIIKSINNKRDEFSNISNYVDDISSNIKTKNLFRTFLILNGSISKQETNIVSLHKNISFEKAVKELRDEKDIIGTNYMKDKKGLEDYFQTPFKPENYKKYYREFTEEYLKHSTKNVIEYLKIQAMIKKNSPWDRSWKEWEKQNVI